MKAICPALGEIKTQTFLWIFMSIRCGLVGWAKCAKKPDQQGVSTRRFVFNPNRMVDIGGAMS
jgi:hypothetical protein